MGIGDMPQAEQDAEDAQRYRHLRDRAGNRIMKKLMDESRSDEWDNLVDRDRKNAEQTRGGSTVPAERQP
jgi:hypothetical protein